MTTAQQIAIQAGSSITPATMLTAIVLMILVLAFVFVIHYHALGSIVTYYQHVDLARSGSVSSQNQPQKNRKIAIIGATIWMRSLS